MLIRNLDFLLKNVDFIIKPELGSKEYNVDDWDEDDGGESEAGGNIIGSPNTDLAGVLPRLNISQRWDTFDISASDEMVIHQHRLRRKLKQSAERKASPSNLLRDSYVPDHTQVLEGLLSENMRAEIRNTDPKVSALPSKSEMKKRHLQRRVHSRMHGASAKSPGKGETSRLALSHCEQRQQDLEEMMAKDAPAVGFETMNSSATGLTGLMHVPSPTWNN